MDALSIKGPFPPRRAAQVLRDQLEGYLRGDAVAPGEEFASESELMRLSGLSRKTIRKALGDLQRAGWLERWPGRGTYVGMRAGNRRPAGVEGRPAEFSRPVRPHGPVRIAVMVHLMMGAHPDWYSMELITGLDQAAGGHGISVELIGHHQQGMAALSQRLERSRPDMLVIMPATSRHAFVAGEAERLGIPCVVTGTRMLDADLPAICEDGVQGARIAVEHFVARGHRRIGLIVSRATGDWVHDRRAGFLEGLRSAGLEADERMVLWTPYFPGTLPQGDHSQLLREFLRKQQPTALLVASSGLHTRSLSILIDNGEIRVPQDLSLIFFDRNQLDYEKYLKFRPTIVNLPLAQTGRQLVEMAKMVAEGKPLSTSPIYLPCEIQEGESVLTREQDRP